MPTAPGAKENLTTRGIAGCPRHRQGTERQSQRTQGGWTALAHGCKTHTDGQAGVRPGRGSDPGDLLPVPTSQSLHP